MESGLKNLFFRRRSKSKPYADKDASQALFQQTSGYAAVSSGPPPKVGALPLKPSQEKQSRNFFTQTKARSGGSRDTRQVAESANIQWPSTSQGVKPYFVGVSKPNGSGAPQSLSSRRTSLDIMPAKHVAPPPVPPLPKDLDSLRGPRHNDIMEISTKQQISRATFNEYVATRNMGLPRKSLDIFETEVNQLAGGRYNEYVATRNIDRTRKSIDRFEEDGVFHNAVPGDTQPSSAGARSVSTGGSRHQSRTPSVEMISMAAPRQGADTSANTQLARRGKSRPTTAGNVGQVSGSDATAKTHTSGMQDTQSSKVAPHSRQHSWNQKNHSAGLSTTSPSRTADFMPAEWLSHGNAATSSDARTRLMTAAIPSRFPDGATLNRPGSATHRSDESSQQPVQTVWDTRNHRAQHITSRSLSMLEGSSGRNPFKPTASTAQRAVVAERGLLRERPSSRTDKIWTATTPRDMHHAYPGSDASSRPSSRGMSTTSSIRKRITVNGRTVMDLTDERVDRSADDVGYSALHEPSGEPQAKNIYHYPSTNLLHSSQAPPTLHILEKDDVSETDAFKSVRTPKPTLLEVGRVDEDGVAAKPSIEIVPSNTDLTAAVSKNNEFTMSESTSPSVFVTLTDGSKEPLWHNQVHVLTESLATRSPQEDPVGHQDWDGKVSQQSEQVYATPESLKSNDFTNPSRAFGITTRDFAVSPIYKQSSDALKRMPQVQEPAKSEKTAPVITTQFHTGQDKVVHHISSFTLPAKQPKTRQSRRSHIIFDEDAFQRKQAEARAALLKLERDLQENFTFAFDSLNKPSAQAAPCRLRDICLEEGGPIAPISRFSPVHAPTSVHRSKVNGIASPSDTSPSESDLQPGSSKLDPAMTNGLSNPSVHSALRNKNGNSKISTISENEDECPSPVDSAPAPTIPFSPASDRGRTMTIRQPMHARMHSTASTGSGTSAFSVPAHLVPERTSSVRDSDVPPFHIGDAGWE